MGSSEWISIQFIYNSGAKGLEIVAGAVKKTGTYFWELGELLVQRGGVKKVLSKVSNDAIQTIEDAYISIVNAYETLKHLIKDVLPRWKVIL